MRLESVDPITEICASADARTLLAVSTSSAEQRRVYLENRTLGPYEAASLFAFSPNGARFAFRIEDRRRQSMVVDGGVGERYIEVDEPLFTQDSLHVAYRAELGGKHFVVYDGVEGKGYERLAGLALMPDGCPCFKALLGDKQAVVIGDVEEKPRDQVGRPVLGAHVAYRARDGKHAFIVCDAQEGPPFDDVSDPVVGEHIGYVATKGEEKFVVVGSTTYGPYTGAEIPVTDGPHFAFVAEREGRATLIVDGVETGLFDAVLYPAFGPRGDVAFVAEENGVRFVVAGSKSGPFDEAVLLTHSPDGSRLAFAARKGHRRFAVVDGTTGPAFDVVDDLVFDPSGRHLAYRGRAGASWHAVIDGTPGPAFTLMTRPVWRDGTWAYAAARGREAILIQA